MPPGPQHDLGVRVQALALLDAGHRLSDIAELTGMTVATVCRMRTKAAARGYDPTRSRKILAEYVMDAPRPGRPRKQKREAGDEEGDCEAGEGAKRKKHRSAGRVVERANGFETVARRKERLMREKMMREREPVPKVVPLVVAGLEQGYAAAGHPSMLLATGSLPAGMAHSQKVAEYASTTEHRCSTQLPAVRGHAPPSPGDAPSTAARAPPPARDNPPTIGHLPLAIGYSPPTTGHLPMAPGHHMATVKGHDLPSVAGSLPTTPRHALPTVTRHPPTTGYAPYPPMISLPPIPTGYAVYPTTSGQRPYPTPPGHAPYPPAASHAPHSPAGHGLHPTAGHAADPTAGQTHPAEGQPPHLPASHSPYPSPGSALSTSAAPASHTTIGGTARPTGAMPLAAVLTPPTPASRPSALSVGDGNAVAPPANEDLKNPEASVRVADQQV